MNLVLTAAEMAELFLQPARTEKDGGYQGLLVGMQKKINRATGQITLTAGELEKISRYAFDYGNGGWENRLMAIFARSLGPKLGR
jgi:hypothetical protein